MNAQDESLAWVRDRLNEHFRAMFGREPRYRYFQKGNGPMFFWTVERYDEGTIGKFAGLYVSGVYRPVGKGSRSGKAETWQLDRDSLSGTPVRREAKARALRLYREKTA
jgi:hypothetical protein